MNPVSEKLSDRAKKLAQMIEHTDLRRNATSNDIKKLCEAARRYGFFAVCVNPAQIRLAKSLIQQSATRVVSVVGFPLGASRIETKRLEAELAIEDGADELDMVVNLGELVSGNLEFVTDEVSEIASVAKQHKVTLKAIIEAPILDRDQIVNASVTVTAAGADFVKTGTGYETRGVTVDDVKTIRYALSGRAGIKAAGGIRTAEFALQLVEAGATRIGTSASTEILDSLV